MTKEFSFSLTKKVTICKTIHINSIDVSFALTPNGNHFWTLNAYGQPFKLDTFVNIERIHLQNANSTVANTNLGNVVDWPIYNVSK